MGRRLRLWVTTLLATILLASAPGAAIAEPGKNQIEAETSSCSNGENYAFVINAMGKAWQLEGTNSNLIVKRYTLSYYDPVTGEFIGSDTYGKSRDGLISCTGEVTTELVGIGQVRVVAEFEAFLTPRSGA